MKPSEPIKLDWQEQSVIDALDAAKPKTLFERITENNAKKEADQKAAKEVGIKGIQPATSHTAEAMKAKTDKIDANRKACALCFDKKFGTTTNKEGK